MAARKHFVKIKKLDKMIKREGYRILYGMCLFQISGGTPEILTEVPHGFP
jgi:hypothetical protein